MSRGRVAGMRDRVCAAPLVRRSRRGALCAARSALARRRPAAGLTRSGSGHRGAVRALFAPVRVSQPCSCFHRSVFPNLLFGQTTDSVATRAGVPLEHELKRRLFFRPLNYVAFQSCAILSGSCGASAVSGVSSGRYIGDSRPRSFESVALHSLLGDA